MLADLDSLEKRVDNLAKKAKGNDKDAQEAKETLDLVNRALALLRDGKPARLVERKPEEEKLFHMLGLLTSMPVLYVCNVEEGSAATGNDFPARSRRARGGRRGLRRHLGQDRGRDRGAAARGARRLSRRDRPEGAGPRPAHPRRLRAAQPDHLFHRRPEGGGGLDDHARHQAPQAAAVIHSDFERGFIRAETIAYDDYVALGGEAGAQDAGKMRLEGKDYVVADGDVMHFRFAT